MLNDALICNTSISIKLQYVLIIHNYVSVRVETGSGHQGYLGKLCHVLSRSSPSDPVYKISGSDPDSALNHVQ